MLCFVFWFVWYFVFEVEYDGVGFCGCDFFEDLCIVVGGIEIGMLYDLLDDVVVLQFGELFGVDFYFVEDFGIVCIFVVFGLVDCVWSFGEFEEYVLYFYSVQIVVWYFGDCVECLVLWVFEDVGDVVNWCDCCFSFFEFGDDCFEVVVFDLVVDVFIQQVGVFGLFGF